MCGQRQAPGTLPTRKTQYPLYRKLSGLQRRSGRVLKMTTPPGLDPRITHPVTSRYTGCVIPAPEVEKRKKIKLV
jgi:hypothetical protein